MEIYHLCTHYTYIYIQEYLNNIKVDKLLLLLPGKTINLDVFKNIKIAENIILRGSKINNLEILDNIKFKSIIIKPFSNNIEDKAVTISTSLFKEINKDDISLAGRGKCFSELKEYYEYCINKLISNNIAIKKLNISDVVFDDSFEDHVKKYENVYNNIECLILKTNTNLDVLKYFKNIKFLKIFSDNLNTNILTSLPQLDTVILSNIDNNTDDIILDKSKITNIKNIKCIRGYKLS